MSAKTNSTEEPPAVTLYELLPSPDSAEMAALCQQQKGVGERDCFEAGWYQAFAWLQGQLHKARKDRAVSAPAPLDLKDLFVETVTERIGRHVLASTIRPATQEDVDKARAAHAEGKCTHICKDDHGWLYDTRCCIICGAGLGTV